MQEEYKKYIQSIICSCGLKFHDFEEFEEHVIQEITDKEANLI